MAGRIAGITLDIGVDITKLQTSLKKVDSQLRNMQGGLRDVDRLLKFNPTNTQLITQKQQLLKQSIEQTKGRLDQLKTAQAQMDAAGVDKNSDAYQRLEREIIATEGKLKNLERQYSQVASVAGVKMQAMGKQMQDIGAKCEAAGQAVTQKLTLPIVALGAASVKAFADVDKGMDAVVKKTGATGKALEDMKQTTKDLATSIPTDFETAGNAVGEVSTRFNITGEELKDLSGTFIKFAQLNNVDVSNSIDKTQKALAAYGKGAESAGGYLDRLNKVGQDTGVSVEKLQDGIVQNATAFKEMGLSLDEATILMGQLEKSGVNSETVLNGMRKALKNAAKEGKPLDQALAEMQDTIENGTGSVDGLTAAYDLFGKSGDQIYGAVKDGMINFKDLAITVDDAGGNIEKTFENTQDPIDKFKMTLNQLKVVGSDLGSALLTTLTPMLDKAKEAITRLTEKFKALSPEQQQMIVKIGLLVAAIGPALVVIGKLTSGIGSIVGVAGKAMNGIASLSARTAGMAGPITAAVAACAAFGVAVYAAYEKHKKEIEAQHEWTEEQKQSLDALKQSTEAYKQAQQAADEKNKSVSAEFEHIRDLKDEYNGLVDANGKIAEKDKDRAEVILGDLASALGLEKDQIQELIDKNGKLSGSIDEVIQKKEAQAYLDANYDSYVKAIEQQTASEQDLAKALQAVDAAEQGVSDAQAQLDKAHKDYDNYLQSGGVKNRATYTRAINAAEIALDKEKSKLAEANKAVDENAQANADAANKISNYQQLQEAVQSGSLKKIGAAMTTYQMNLKTATTASKSELTKQAVDAQNNLKSIEKAYKEGKATKTAVDSAKKRADAAAAEAKKVGASMDDIKKKVKDGASKSASSANKGFGDLLSNIQSKMAAADKSVDKNTGKIKKKFPMSLGKMFSFSLPSLSVGSKTEKGFKLPTFSSIFHWHKDAYTNPLLFTSPTIVPTAGGGHGFGDGNGAELVYGHKNLMNDIQSAVAGVQSPTTINVYVDGAERPEEWANRFIQEYQLQTRTA